jgi:hypothetical protein
MKVFKTLHTTCNHCLDTIRISELTKHEKLQCPKRPVQCLVCQKPTILDQLYTHHTTNCDEYINQCRFCHEKMPAKFICEHLKVCPEITNRLSLLIDDKKEDKTNDYIEKLKDIKNHPTYAYQFDWNIIKSKYYRVLLASSQYNNSMIEITMKQLFDNLSTDFIENYAILMKRRLTLHILRIYCYINDIKLTGYIEWHDNWHVHVREFQYQNKHFHFEFVRRDKQKEADKYYDKIKKSLLNHLTRDTSNIILKYALPWASSHFDCRMLANSQQDDDDKKRKGSTTVAG